jgi:hypothetical protein
VRFSNSNAEIGTFDLAVLSTLSKAARARFEGTAKLMPSHSRCPSFRAKMAVLIPTISPFRLMQRPTGVPVIHGGIVWRYSTVESREVRRPLALMIPAVTVSLSPERFSNRKDQLANPDGFAISDAKGLQVWRVDLEYGDINVRDRYPEPRGEGALVREGPLRSVSFLR